MTRAAMRRLIARVPWTILGAGALCAAWTIRPHAAWAPPPVDLSAPTSRPADPRAAPSLDSLAVIWRRDLRQPLKDDKPETAPPPVVTECPLKLVGTAVESERRYGVFEFNGRTFVRAVGAVIQGFELLEIERGRAQLRNSAGVVELQVPRYERIARP